MKFYVSLRKTVINVINIAALIPIFDSVQQYSLWIYPDGPHVGHMNLVIGYLSISSCLDAQLDCAQGGLGCEQMFLFPNGLSKPICPLQDSWNSYPANVKWGAKQHCSVRRHVVHAHQCVDIEIVDYVLLNSLLINAISTDDDHFENMKNIYDAPLGTMGNFLRRFMK